MKSLICTCAISISSAALLTAQESPGALVSAARVQIDELNIDSAATLLRRALAPAAGAAGGVRVRGLVLLGITELIVGRESPARQAFREALRLEPGLQVDSLAYLSSELLPVFGEERAAAPAVETERAAAVARSVLDIRGAPPEATIRVDGTEWSVPRAAVEPGTHAIEVQASGYETYRANVTVAEGGTRVHEVRLVQLPPGRLSITSAPWGVVYLDGRRLGETPLAERYVDAGSHVIALEVPGRPRVERPLRLASQEHVRLPLMGGGAPSRSPFPFTRADSLYEATEFDEAVTLYRRVLQDRQMSLEPAQRAKAATRIGTVFYAKGRSLDHAAFFDSAQAYFRMAYSLAPSYAPGPGEMGPDLRTSFDLARAAAFRIAVEVTPDTLVHRSEGTLQMLVRPTRPARVAVAVVDAQGRTLYTESQGVEGAGAFRWDLRGPGMRDAAWGMHSLRLTATSEQGEDAPVVEFQVELEPERVDTAPIPPPLLESALEPESTSVNRGWNLGKGLLLGGLAALAVPWWSSVKYDDVQPGFNAKGFAIGGSLILAGVIGTVTAPPTKALPENIEINRRRREELARQRAETAEANQRIRDAARIHIRTERVR